MTVHQNLRDLRQISGLTQEEAASRVGLTRQAISGYESGRRQPDMDMLLKLAELYHTDLLGVVYGRGSAQKKMRRFQIAALMTFLVPLLLTLMHSCLILFANTCFPVAGDMLITEATRPLIETRLAVIGAWELLEGLAQAASFAGCILLAVLLPSLTPLPSMKHSLLFVLAFLLGGIAVTLPFSAFDPCYLRADYMLILLHTFLPVVLLWNGLVGMGLFKSLCKKRQGRLSP